MKPKILLIPNVGWWIIGEMGKQIIKRFRDDYDFYFLPESVLLRRPDLLQDILPAMDAVHCLNESGISILDGINSRDLPPIATWIHHVTVWSKEHQAAVDKSSSLTVCTGPWKRYVEQRLSHPCRVTVVPHGIDTEFFRRTEVDRAKFKIPQGSFAVGFIASKASDRDQRRKGIDTLFAVIRKLSGSLPNLHVVFCGPGWDEEVLQLGSAGISASGTGYIRKSELPSLYSALNVYLLTSRVEGGPCTVFEAMACETPVVATRVGSVPDLIRDGVNGYSADVDDFEQLANSIMKLASEGENRRELGIEGRRTVEKLSWGSALEPLKAVYDELVEQRRRSGIPARGPAWLDAPEVLLNASCAGDCILQVVTGVRAHHLPLSRGLVMLREMLHGLSFMDCLRGVGMAKGLAFKSRSIGPRRPARIEQQLSAINAPAADEDAKACR